MIFISYASEDQIRARGIADTLSKLGAEIWFDERDVEPSGPFVRRIEEALEAAALVLVLWSGSAAGSRWVQRERDSTIARQGSGAPVGLVMARLDDTPVPYLAASDRSLDMRDPRRDEEHLAGLASKDSAAGVPGDLKERIRSAVVPRESVFKEIVGRVETGHTVVMLSPRRAGSSTILRQLQHRLAGAHPDWAFRSLAVQNLPGEGVEGYLERLRGLMEIPKDRPRLVLSVDGWSDTGDEHTAALAQELRVRLVEGPDGRRVSLVAAGGFSLYLLWLGTAQRSAFTNARRVDVPDIEANDVMHMMEEVSPGLWSEEDAGEVCRRGGGHPHLVKRILTGWAEDPARGWSGAEEAMENVDDFLDYLRPQLYKAARDERARKALLECVGEGGARRPFDPHAPEHRLYFKGLLRRRGNRLVPRCGVVGRWMREVLELEGEGRAA